VNPIALPRPQGPKASHPPARRHRPWDSLSGDEKRLFARDGEVYAGFLAMPTSLAGCLTTWRSPGNAKTRW